jgi:hypothetical protein
LAAQIRNLPHHPGVPAREVAARKPAQAHDNMVELVRNILAGLLLAAQLVAMMPPHCDMLCSPLRSWPAAVPARLLQGATDFASSFTAPSVQSLG